MKPTDRELMMRVRDGDVGQLGALFERHHVRLYNFCLRLTGDRQLSEDLIQEVFFRILKHRRTYRAEGDFLPWAFRFVRNVCADHFRKQGRGPALETPVEEAPREPSCERPLASAELESAEARELLRHALERLPLERREVLLLSRFQGLKYQEIAELLGCTAGAVKLRVHRAVKQLREVYLELSTEVV